MNVLIDFANPREIHFQSPILFLGQCVYLHNTGKGAYMSKFSRAMSAIVLVSFLGLSGCLIGASNRTHREGAYISEETLKKVEPGKTTSTWVLATFGEPSEKSSIEKGEELWKYTYKETKDSDGFVFLLFGGSDHKVTGGQVFVELKDGVVTKCWRG